MSKSGEHALLSDALEHVTAQANRLAQVIAEEGLALRELDIDRLNDRVRSKRELVAELINGDRQLRALLAQNGHQQGAEITDFLNNIAPTTNLSAAWEKYLSILEHCNALNKENRTMVTIGIRHTSRALDFLRGQSGSQVLYGPQGQQLKSNSANIIAKA